MKKFWAFVYLCVMIVCLIAGITMLIVGKANDLPKVSTGGAIMFASFIVGSLGFISGACFEE